MTALLAIDCATKRVRRYETRRVGGRPRMTDEVALLSQVDPDFDVELCKRQLEEFRATRDLPFPHDHLPDAA